jgi:hypothetical protein
VTRNGGALGTPLAANTSADGTTFTWPGLAAILSTDVLTVPTTVVDFTAPTPLHVLAQTTYAPVANTVAPQISAAIHSVFSATQGTFDLHSDAAFAVASGTVIVSAKPGAAADGAFGGAFFINAVAPTSGALAVTTSTTGGVTTINIGYPAGLFATNAQFATALNANATFNAILVANGTAGAGSGPTIADGTVGGHPLVGGSTTFNISAVLSKAVVNGANLVNTANWAINVASGAAPPLVVTPNNAAQPTVVTLTYTAGTAAAAVVAGTTTVTFKNVAPVVDFAGNGMPTQTVTVS